MKVMMVAINTFNSLFGILVALPCFEPATCLLSTPFSGFGPMPKPAEATVKLSTPFSGFLSISIRICSRSASLSTPFSGFRLLRSPCQSYRVTFQLPFRDSLRSLIALTPQHAFNSLFGIHRCSSPPLHLRVAFQLPFRDSPATSAASASMRRLSTPFSGFFDQRNNQSGGSNVFQLPFRDSLIIPARGGRPPDGFQLPFRDSEPSGGSEASLPTYLSTPFSGF